MPMPKTEVNFEKLKSWIIEYYENNGKTPRMEDYYRHLGAPYSKSVVLKEYGSLKNLYDLIGLPSRSNIKMSEEYKLNLLMEVRRAIYSERITNFKELRKKGLISRDSYTYSKVFGSWKNTVLLSGIAAEQRVLIRYFDTYNGEEPITFLKKTIGVDGDFTPKQKSLINRVKSRKLKTTNDFQKHIGYVAIKREFMYGAILQIAAGLIPRVNYNTGIKYKAIDGHMCDSQSEMELDNWLTENNYDHEVHVPYPNSDMISDFKVRNYYIEYAGLLSCGYPEYDEKIQKKIDYASQMGMKLVVISSLSAESLNRLKAHLDGDILDKIDI